MKKFLSLILTLTITLTVLPFGLFSIVANAQTNNNFTWTIDGTWLTISGDGVIDKEFYNSNLKDKSITQIIFNNGTMSLGDYAFEDCTGLKFVFFTDKIECIGKGAFSGCSNLEYLSFTGDIRAIGANAFAECKKIQNVVISNLSNWCNITFENHFSNPVTYSGKLTLNGASVTDAVIPEGVTSINDYAFYNCTGLKSVSLPDSITKIGKNAFENCTSLTAIEIPDGVQVISNSAFKDCTALSNLALSENLTTIDNSAFENCQSLDNINIPSSVKTVGRKAFYNCKSLNAITFPEDLKSIGDKAFYNTAWYNGQNDGIVYAGKVLYKCKGSCPTNVNIKAGTISITENAFYFRRELTSITIPDSVENIGASVFENCNALTNVSMGESLVCLPENVFRNCTALEEIYIPNSVSDISDTAFENCTAINAINVAKDNSVYSSEGNCLIKTDTNELILGCKNSVIPNCVTTICENAFNSYSALEDLIIPANVTNIENTAFYNCGNLKSITVQKGNPIYHSYNNCLIETATNELILGCKNSTIPDYVTTIGGNAFYGCTNLETITIGKGVTDIRNSAFENCTNLKDMTLYDNIAHIDSRAFYNCSQLNNVYYLGNKAKSVSVKIQYGNVHLTTASWCYKNDIKDLTDYAIYVNNSNSTIQSDRICFGELGMPKLALEANKTYTLKFDVYTTSKGTNAQAIYCGVTDSYANATAQKSFDMIMVEKGWQTNTVEFTTTDILAYHTLCAPAGFVGYFDNLRVFDGENEISVYTVDSNSLGKTNSSAEGVILPNYIVDAKNDSYDYAIYIDNSQNNGTSGIIELNNFGMIPLQLEAGKKYTLKFDTYTISSGTKGTTIYRGITDIGAPATEPKFYTSDSIAVGIWQTHTFELIPTQTLAYHTIKVNPGFVGYIDDFCIYEGENEINVCGFAPNSVGKTDEQAIGAVLPGDIADEKHSVYDYGILIDNSQGTDYGKIYLHELGMPDISLPAGSYTVKFDFYALSIGNGNLPIRITKPDWSGDALSQKWINLPNKTNEWFEISLSATTTDIASFPWFYVGAGIKGYMDNFKIINNDTGEVCLNFELTPDDYGKVSETINTVTTIPKGIQKPTSSITDLENDYAILIDNSKGTGYGQLYLHEVGMPRISLPAGSYTVKFDFYAFSIGNGNFPIQITRPDWKGDALSQKWINLPNKTNEWFEVSLSVTTTDISSYPWFYVGAGIKGYMDNFKIIDNNTGEVCLNFKVTKYDVNKTSKSINTVVALPSSISDAKHAQPITVPNYAIYIDNSSNTTYSSRIWFNLLSVKPLALASGKTYTLKYNTYALSVSTGNSCYVPVNSTGGGVSTAYRDENWFKAYDQLNTWRTQSVQFTIEDVLAYHTMNIGAGFKGYLDDFCVYYNGTLVAELYFDSTNLGKTSGGATVVQLPESVTSNNSSCQHTYTVKTELPDCAEAGAYIYTCTKCGYSYTTEIEKIAHKYTTVTTAPTCTDSGYTTYTCFVCGDIRIINDVASAGHKYSITTTSPTCTESGSTTYACSICGKHFTAEKVPNIEHTYDNDYDADCNVCGDVREVFCAHEYDNACDADCNLCSEVREVGDHVYGDWVVDVAATTNKAGSKHRECSECGAKETEVIPMVFGFRGASLELQSSLGII
ncbi:MAG: leucine-rich repeat domain-containing protein, partial [Clostridia bacterium]|nr:leucine-rich repeat domain-containing protein [Clostridia bacterium]